MKKTSTSVFISFVLTSALLFAGLFIYNPQFSVASFSPSPTPSCGVETYEFSNSGSNSRVAVNFDSNFQIDATGQNGWVINNLWLDAQGGGTNYVSYGGGNKTNFNPSDMGNIDKVKVEVSKACPSASPSVSPSTSPLEAKVDVCHEAGQSGNYTSISVSVHSVNDANGLNGHGDHSGDVWAPFTYNDVLYPGQGNYNDFNFEDCSPITSPTPEPTQSPEPEESPTPEPTPNLDVCANIDGIQTSVPEGLHLDAGKLNCVSFSVPGPGDQGTGGGEVLGTSAQVLGTSTMAATGTAMDAVLYSIFTFGSLLTSFGIMKNGKKEAILNS